MVRSLDASRQWLVPALVLAVAVTFASAEKAAGASGAPPEEEPRDLNWLGCLLSAMSSTCTNFGVAIQKTSHNKNQLLPKAERLGSFKRPMWCAGLLMMVLGGVLDFLALAYCSQVLVAVVGGACTILASFAFATFWLKDRVLKTDVMGAILIIVAVVFAALAAPVDVTCAPAHLQVIHQTCLEVLEEQFETGEFLLYLAVVCGIICALYYRVNSEAGRTDAWAHHTPALCGVLSGVMGSLSVLLAKCASQILVEFFAGVKPNPFASLQSWLFVGGMLFCVITQTTFLNKGIQMGDTLSVLPFFQVSWIGFCAAGGIVFYQEGPQLSANNNQGWLSYAVAWTMMIGGIFLIAQHARLAGELETSLLEETEDGDGGHRRSALLIKVSRIKSERSFTRRGSSIAVLASLLAHGDDDDEGDGGEDPYGDLAAGPGGVEYRPPQVDEAGGGFAGGGALDALPQPGTSQAEYDEL